MSARARRPGHRHPELGLKTTQYTNRERVIIRADGGGIWERWMYGLRLLNDPAAFAKGSTQLKPGTAEKLIAAAAKAGIKLSDREIRWRLECAKAYKTEAEIRNASSEFPTWTELRVSGFPPFDVDADEPAADYRTKDERQHDHARALLDHVGPQGALFSLADLEPTTTTLLDLQTYAKEQAGITARFAERDAKREDYLNKLIEAADGDLTTTWQDAQDQLNALDPDAYDGTVDDEGDES